MLPIEGLESALYGLYLEELRALWRKSLPNENAFSLFEERGGTFLIY